MDRKNFKDYEELALSILNEYISLAEKDDGISIIAKYTAAQEILKELISTNSYDIAWVELQREDIEGYSDEYILTINNGSLWCEKFKHEYGYLMNESTVTYIMDDCSSNVLKHCNCTKLYEVSIGEEKDGAFYPSSNETEEMHGFTISKYSGDVNQSYSFYTTENYSRDDLDGLLEKFKFLLD